jgi:tRNA pseudouridine55 synthase
LFGILLIDKPHGVTSHDVVNDVRRKFGTRRVGHAGTLDPLATGLLVVAVGPATRFLQYLPLEPKVYEGDITFGHATTTYDAEGEATSGGDVPADLTAAFQAALPAFKGLIQQLPPMHSAVKVAGKPLYKYAREGKVLEREPRTVHIESIDVQAIEGATISVRIVCSGGTYIRSLAHDIGKAVGCGAFLSRLRRTDVGRFGLDRAVTLDQARPADLLPLREALPPMPMLPLTDVQTDAIREGRTVLVGSPPDSQLAALLDPHGDVFSVARVVGNLLQPECVIPSEAVHGSL